MNLIDQINQHKNLYLEHLGDPGDNTLRIILAEAIVSDQLEEFAVGNTVLSGRPIISDESCSRYEVIFDHYATYAVLNESYTQGGPNDPNMGLLFRPYPN